MNQRLVESVAQIVMAMSTEERRLLGRNLQDCGLPWPIEPEEDEKSARVAEIAQEIQSFEARRRVSQPLPSTSEVDASTDVSANSVPGSSEALQSLLQMTQSLLSDTVSNPPSDDANWGYAFYEMPDGSFSKLFREVPSQT